MKSSRLVNHGTSFATPGMQNIPSADSRRKTSPLQLPQHKQSISANSSRKRERPVADELNSFMDGENDDDHCSKRQRQKSNNLRWNHDLQEQLLILYSNFKKDKNVEKGLKQAFWMEDVILSILSNISSFFCRKIWNLSLLFTNSLYI